MNGAFDAHPHALTSVLFSIVQLICCSSRDGGTPNCSNFLNYFQGFAFPKFPKLNQLHPLNHMNLNLLGLASQMK
jgi:hypothetical protein